MNKLHVSNECYEELASLFKTMPPSHLVDGAEAAVHDDSFRFSGKWGVENETKLLMFFLSYFVFSCIFVPLPYPSFLSRMHHYLSFYLSFVPP